MLILSRKIGDAVMIGDDIKVMVVDIRGDKIRIGIEASANTPVHREEVYQAILREREINGEESK